jgi:hypothetical protein
MGGTNAWIKAGHEVERVDELALNAN